MKKKLMFAIAAVAAMVACNPDDAALKKSVSFENPFPEMQNDEGVFKVVVSNYAETAPLEIPVTFGGSAEKGVDYEVSAEAFVWGGESPVTEITVTPLVLASDKEVTLTLNMPSGFVAGSYPVATYSFSGKLGYASFESNVVDLIGKAEITVTVVDGNGAGLALPDGAEIAVEVDTENSTAVEGTHFQFVDGKKAAVIPAGGKKGTFAIETLGAFDSEHSKIVLKLVDNKFYIGEYETVEITFVSYWAQLAGTWQINELVADKTYMQNTWWCEADDLVGYPEFVETDKVTFDIVNGKFVPAMTGGFENYFLGEANLTNEGGYVLQGMVDLSLQLLEIDNVNRNFSATSASDEKKAYIGVQIYLEEETGEEVLDMYLLDYKSTDFLSIFDLYECWNPTRPTATMSGMPINITFKRVSE